MSAQLSSLLLLDAPVALALGSLVLSFGISIFGLSQVALKRKGIRHE